MTNENGKAENEIKVAHERQKWIYHTTYSYDGPRVIVEDSEDGPRLSVYDFRNLTLDELSSAEQLIFRAKRHARELLDALDGKQKQWESRADLAEATA